MWREHKVSVIFPTYNEKDSIRESIEDFFACEYVDEIIVVNNNAAEGTDAEVEQTRATLVHEEKQGYGHAIQRGFAEAKGDLLIIAEPDGTFSGHDVYKLLAYSDDVPVVFGTRTSQEFIWEGANMGFLLKYGNWGVGKMMEFLFNTSILTDVGCSMRLLRREVYETLKPQFSVGGSAFGPHLMLLVFMNGFKFTEIPVNYKRRVGVSSVTGSLPKAVFLGMEMAWMVLRYRVLSWMGVLPKKTDATPDTPDP